MSRNHLQCSTAPFFPMMACSFTVPLMRVCRAQGRVERLNTIDQRAACSYPNGDALWRDLGRWRCASRATDYPPSTPPADPPERRGNTAAIPPMSAPVLLIV